MDTNRIRYFLSLAKTESISRAAELHHISAAAFSKAMKVFEGEVGKPLTLSSGRGIILTDYAQSLVPRLESIIQQIDSIHDGLAQESSAHHVLRVATFEVFSTYFMTKVIGDAFRDFHCEIHEAIPGKIEDAVASGKVDLGLTYLPIPHPDLDFLKVAEIEMGIFAHRKFLKSDHSVLPFAIPISPIEGSPNKAQGLDGWPDHAFPRYVQFRVEMLQTALGLCSSGLAAAYLPNFVANLYNETVKPSLVIEKLPFPKKFPKQRDYVYLIKRKSDQEGATAKKLAQMVRKICARG